MGNLTYDNGTYVTIDGVRMPDSIKFIDFHRQGQRYDSWGGIDYFTYGPTTVTAQISNEAELVLHIIDPPVNDRDWQVVYQPPRDWQ